MNILPTPVDLPDVLDTRMTTTVLLRYSTVHMLGAAREPNGRSRSTVSFNFSPTELYLPFFPTSVCRVKVWTMPEMRIGKLDLLGLVGVKL